MTEAREFALCAFAGVALWIVSLAWHDGARYPGGQLEYPYQAKAALLQGCARGEFSLEAVGDLHTRLMGDRWIATSLPRSYLSGPAELDLSGVIDAREGRLIECRYIYPYLGGL